MSDSILVYILAEGGIIAAVLAFYLSRLGRKMDKQEEVRIRESVVTTTMLKAIGHLADATAIAQQCGKCNGEMETARKYYIKANDGLTEYLVQQSAERVHAR